MASASRGRKVAQLVVISSAVAIAAGCGGGGAGTPGEAPIVALVREWYAQSNPAVCAQLTDRLLYKGWGKSGEAGRQACRTALAKAKPDQAVVVEEPGINGKAATVKVDYTRAGKRYADEIRFVLLNGAWLADDLTAGLRPTPAPSQTTSTGATTQAQTQVAPATTGQTSTGETSTARSSTGTLVPPPAQFLASLQPAGGSRERGTAVLRATQDGKTFATLLMKHTPRGAAQAAVIVHGSCDNPGAAAYQLRPVTAGVSGKTLPAPLQTFRGTFAVVVHEKGATSAIAACGDLHSG